MVGKEEDWLGQEKLSLKVMEVLETVIHEVYDVFLGLKENTVILA